MTTQTQSDAATPELTISNRVASIPLVNDSLSAVHASLVSNPLTRSPYNTAQALSSTALRYSEPFASKLAPIIVRADGVASEGLDPSNSQLQQLQSGSVSVQRAPETAESFENLASSDVVAAQAKVSTLSDTDGAGDKERTSETG